jgi:hypothetical protein
MFGGGLMVIKGEWFFRYDDGPETGPFCNSMKTEGLERLATLIHNFLPSPFIAMGDSGGEAFRKSVGAIVQTGAVLRLRTTLSLSEGNGSHTWVGVFSDATVALGSGIQINELTQNFSKTESQILNIECRFTIQQGA